MTRAPRVQQLDSVADASSRDPEADVLRFTAVARPDLAGFKTWSVRSTRQVSGGSRTAAMVPMVPPNWERSQPVPLWVRVDASGADGPDHPAMQAELDALANAATSGPISVNVTQTLEAEVDMEGTNAFQIGTRRAMQEHGLASPAGTVLATWPAKTSGPLRLAD